MKYVLANSSYVRGCEGKTFFHNEGWNFEIDLPCGFQTKEQAETFVRVFGIQEVVIEEEYDDDRTCSLPPGRAIECRRRELGLSQTEAGLRIKPPMSQPQWSQIESEEYNPTMEMLKKIAQAIECEPRDLM